MKLVERIAQEFKDVRNHSGLSSFASYHLLEGNLSISNTVLTTGFGLYLYTGNGGVQTINLGMDLESQWGDNANETYGYLIKIKSRSATGDWTWVNSVRGSTKYISSNTTAVEGTDANMFTLSTVGGVTTLNIGTSTRTNTNGVTYVVEVYQTTHRKTGTTNQGKAFTEHYNPYTGFTINGYEGSGVAGHEIPHSLDRKLGFITTKGSSIIGNWSTIYEDNKFLYINGTNASGATSSKLGDDKSRVAFGSEENTASATYILYGWANSYFDESGKLIGNFEIGVYQGTANATGLNKITTKAKLALFIPKRLDTTGSWYSSDNQRNNGDSLLVLNTSQVEIIGTDYFDYVSDGIICKSVATELNASGGQYLYFGVYDNDSGSGKSKYYKATDNANVQVNNALIPLAKGFDSNGAKNEIVIANETITGVTWEEGKNYLYKTSTGYGVSSVEPSYGIANPLLGDFFHMLENKWYDNTNTEITESRNYMNHIVHADSQGNPLFVEELPKVKYENIIKANEFRGKNACTAWVVFDGATTPVTIRDSYNVSKVIRTATGVYDMYFEEDMDSTTYAVSTQIPAYNNTANSLYSNATTNKVTITSTVNDIAYNGTISVQIFGGKN